MRVRVFYWILLSLAFIMILGGSLWATEPWQDRPQLSTGEVIAIARQWLLDYGNNIKDFESAVLGIDRFYNGVWSATYVGDGRWVVYSKIRHTTHESVFEYYENISSVNYLGRK